MNRITLYRILLAFVMVLVLKEALQAQAANKAFIGKRQPNIILIISDDQGYGDFSCFGNPVLKTPNMDKLYGESTRFTNFYVSPVCSPSRASIMTGRYNYRTGVWDTWQGRAEMHPDEATIAEMLAAAGYRTGLFGKWHLGTNPPKRPQEQGFQEVFTGGGNRFNPTMTNNGITKTFPGYMDDLIFDKAMDFIATKNHQPFFAVVASLLPHDIGGKQVPDVYVEPYLSAPNLTQGDKEVYGMLSKLDENIGRLMTKIKKLNLDEHTVIMYVSDNGPLVTAPDAKSKPEQLAAAEKNMGNRYNRGFRGGKASVYEGGIKVPFFIRWPGVYKAGKDINTLAAHIDILPTVLDIAGVSKPAHVKIDGASLVDLLTGKKKQLPNRTLFIQSDRKEIPERFVNSAVINERYKLIDGKELYDLKSDPLENNNIASQHPKQVAALRKEYEQWFIDVQKGRGFIPSYTLVGSDADPQVSFGVNDRFSTGWPLKVVKEGLYQISIKDIQSQLFKNGGFIGIKIGEQRFKKPIPKEKATVVFDAVQLPKGDIYIDVFTEGEKAPKKMYYGNEDLGYRNLIIKKN